MRVLARRVAVLSALNLALLAPLPAPANGTRSPADVFGPHLDDNVAALAVLDQAGSGAGASRHVAALLAARVNHLEDCTLKGLAVTS